jgi:hypothetical protein
MCDSPFNSKLLEHKLSAKFIYFQEEKNYKQFFPRTKGEAKNNQEVNFTPTFCMPDDPRLLDIVPLKGFLPSNMISSWLDH